MGADAGATVSPPGEGPVEKLEQMTARFSQRHRNRLRGDNIFKFLETLLLRQHRLTAVSPHLKMPASAPEFLPSVPPELGSWKAAGRASIESD